MRRTQFLSLIMNLVMNYQYICRYSLNLAFCDYDHKTQIVN